MVLPLVDEDKPKCYICHKGFEDIDELRDHQAKQHGAENNHSRDPAPGDVTVF